MEIILNFTKFAYVIFAEDRCFFQVDFSYGNVFEIAEFETNGGTETDIGIIYALNVPNDVCMKCIESAEFLEMINDEINIFASDSLLPTLCGTMLEPQPGRSFDELVNFISFRNEQAH